MKAIKVSKNESVLIDLGTKKILKYPLKTRLMSVAYMKISGRNPNKGFLLENDCAFCLYVTKGKGKVYAGAEKFNMGVGDVLYVPTETEFAVEGEFEYITFDTPGFYPEQSEEV